MNYNDLQTLYARYNENAKHLLVIVSRPQYMNLNHITGVNWSKEQHRLLWIWLHWLVDDMLFMRDTCWKHCAVLSWNYNLPIRRNGIFVTSIVEFLLKLKKERKGNKWSSYTDTKSLKPIPAQFADENVIWRVIIVMLIYC